jgi:hypothetical protein
MMANLLAHCLSAMALQSVVNPFLGHNFLSESSFLAGIVGMLIHLDSDGYNGRRTPLLHSVTFGAFYSWISSTTLTLMFWLELMSLDSLMTLFTIVPTGFAAHLLADGFTEEGIFLFPESMYVRDWFRRRPDPEQSWLNWKRYSFGGKRKNDDPVLNLCFSSASLAALIAFLALTPL